MEEHNKLIERFAEIQSITYEEAEQKIGAETDEEILNNIQNLTAELIKEKIPTKLNRAQRRQLQKKVGKKNVTMDTIADTAKKINYIDLIQKLRILNEKNEKEIEENEGTN